ncbi:MAG: carboxynorspermidine decarboxylase, partial [Muribaculaceae bacterium]|nr:carboxynorspermidine decarboxylase [Muribaculaceae bacterium]
FGVMREYGVKFPASSLNALRLGNEELGCLGHSYCPAYTPATIGEYLNGSSHLTFNSLSQFARYKGHVSEFNAKNSETGRRVSPGLRVNPSCSVIETDIYNPALPGSRFGVTARQIGEKLPDGVEGLHFHQLCESSSYDLEKVLAAFEQQFGKYLPQVKWVNMGGGHLMTREGYDTAHLIGLLKGFRDRYPWLKVILEPGSAFTWRTGDLITSVVDVVENQGIKTAIIDASFACHMPDTLEMPYQPAITESCPDGEHVYRLGGNSCLSGDYMGDWRFDRPLQEGDRLTLEDMNHYTTVKTNMFNGISHPSMVFERLDGTIEMLREFSYEDYKSRMD